MGLIFPAGSPTYSFLFGTTPELLRGSTSQTAAGTWISLEECDNFCKNTTNETVRKTVIIKNTDSFSLGIDIDGTIVDSIPGGKTREIIVDIPAGKTLHAQGNGEYLASV